MAKYKPRIYLVVVTEDSKSELEIKAGPFSSAGPSKAQLRAASEALLKIAMAK